MPTAAETLDAATGTQGSETAKGGAGATGSATTGAQGGGAAPQAFWNGWVDPADKDTRDWLGNKNFPDPKTFVSTARTLEREAATLRSAKPGYPTDELGPDGKPTPAYENARKAWNMVTGVPDSPEKYDIPLPADNPYPQFKELMAKGLHEVGVPAAMAPKLAKAYETAVQQMEAQLREQENTQSKAAMVELEHAWGAQYKERVAFAARGKEWLAKEVGGLNDLQLRTMEAVLGTPKFMQAMWKIGAGNQEARFAGGEGGASNFGNTASEAQNRLDQITADRSAGKISDFEWRTKYEAEALQLRDRIVAGMAAGNA